MSTTSTGTTQDRRVIDRGHHVVRARVAVVLLALAVPLGAVGAPRPA